MNNADLKKAVAARGREEIYTQEPMCNWLGPMLLVQTGIRSAIATTLGAFADPREVQAALTRSADNPPLAVGDGGAVWVDYVADTGDGWDATYSVAWCLAQGAVADGATLPRADVLLLGGDQVYPTPANDGYRSRFLDPFRSAFPAPVPLDDSQGSRGSHDRPVADAGAPLMVAIPGNHDWYDGLRAFAQLFCNRKPVGRWRTEQRTSYYALDLRNGWWIWGLDLQLESAIDRPQRDYFEAMAARLGADDRVILCVPEPSWIEESERVRRARECPEAAIETRTPRFCSLKEVEELLGPRLALSLAGDSHHYARYAPDASNGSAAPMRITCGGGGAFLHGTHQLDRTLRFHVGGAEQRYTQQCVYPTPALSRRLRNHGWWLPGHNPSFCGLLAVLYLLFAWLLQSASQTPHARLGGMTLMESLSRLPLSPANAGTALAGVGAVLAHSPGAVLLALAIVGGAAAFTQSSATRDRKLACAAGAVHGLLHLVLAMLLVWGLGRFNLVVLDRWGWSLRVDDVAQVLLFLGETLLAGGVLGGLLFGFWMVLTNALRGWHCQDVFSAQRIPDHKTFLRMRVDEAGITIHPMKIAHACRRWRVADGIAVLQQVGRRWRLKAFADSGARFQPAEGTLRAEPLEAPFYIPRHAGGKP